jgi:hypothetical protein
MSLKKAFVILSVSIACLVLFVSNTLGMTITGKEQPLKESSIQKINLKTIASSRASFAAASVAPTYIEWGYYYGVSGQNSMAKSMIGTNDGGYFIPGQVDYGQDHYIYLVKTNSNGLVVWSWTYGDAGFQFEAKSAQQTSDNGYIIVGSYKETTATRYGIFLLKTDSLGQIEWVQEYQGGVNGQYGFGVKQYTDGGYVVSGARDNNSAVNTLVFRTNITGTLLWERLVSTSTGYGSMVLIERNTANIVVLTESNTAQTTTLLKYNSSGAVLLQRDYPYSTISFVHSFKQCNNGTGYLLCGDINPFSGSDGNFVLFKVDNSFEYVWLRQYGTGGNYAGGGDVEETADGGYLMSAYAFYSTSTGSSNRDVLLIKTLASGTVEWGQQFDFSSYDDPLYVHCTSDNGYILGGATIVIPGNIFMLKLK